MAMENSIGKTGAYIAATMREERGKGMESSTMVRVRVSAEGYGDVACLRERVFTNSREGQQTG